ncbi:hypothetical protein N8198_03015, partial [Gammaproteobacteria bacterium]|nr:hypothetical protein [Gammaproteobacteria bacterium]
GFFIFKAMLAYGFVYGSPNKTNIPDDFAVNQKLKIFPKLESTKPAEAPRHTLPNMGWGHRESRWI